MPVPLPPLSLGLSSTRQFRGETGQIETGKQSFSAFNDGLNTNQIIIIGVIGVVGLFVWKRFS